MMAITLWQPWAWAISDYTKRIENRTWAPPDWRKGQTMAIHAGATIDPNGIDSIEAAFPVIVPRDLPIKSIVAVTRYCGYLTESDDPWFAGPCGWVFDSVARLDSPVFVRGHQGLWRVPKDVEARIIKQAIAQHCADGGRMPG